MAGRYGTEQFIGLRSQFGWNGTRLVYVLAVIVLTMGWLAVLAMMFGRSIDGLTALASGTEANPLGIKATVAAIGAILLTWFIVAKGPTSIKVFNMIVSPALVILMVVMQRTTKAPDAQPPPPAAQPPTSAPTAPTVNGSWTISFPSSLIKTLGKKFNRVYCKGQDY